MINKTKEGKPKMVRAMRKTGKTINGHTVYESTNPETKKLFQGVPSLADLEGGPKAFGMPHIKPSIKVGDMVFVNWNNNQTYKGIIRKKLRKNWGIEITDDAWNYPSNQASIPEHALVKRNYE